MIYASVALFRREGRTTFKPPRKEASPISTQARKSAARHWANVINEPDRLTKVFTMCQDGAMVRVSERLFTIQVPPRPWIDRQMTVQEAAAEPHLSACLAELGIDPQRAPPPMPDTLEINSIIYRREI
ncbi:hypothetical protein AX761_24330 [Rhizobium sp. 58]|nr:hypothetical protein AX761_24330 [Rhizobium sp. 58]